ncbi:hypothetical protein VN97_g8208, partial [Penicillium thymicola]
CLRVSQEAWVQIPLLSYVFFFFFLLLGLPYNGIYRWKLNDCGGLFLDIRQEMKMKANK